MELETWNFVQSNFKTIQFDTSDETDLKDIKLSWNLPKKLLLIWRCYDVFYVCLLWCIKLYSFEVALCKISGLQHQKILKLLIHEPLTIFLNPPVHWNPVCFIWQKHHLEGFGTSTVTSLLTRTVFMGSKKHEFYCQHHISLPRNKK